MQLKRSTPPHSGYSMKVSAIYPIRPLTDQQLRIVELVGLGLKNADIGRELRPERPFSADTIRQYVRDIAMILQSEKDAPPRMKVAAYAVLLAVRAELAADSDP